MILLQFEHFFYGKEDIGLFEKKLKPEASAILNWTLIGLKRLRARGHFKQPESGKESIKLSEELGSNVISFFNDRCEAGTKEDVVMTERLFTEWVNWCSQNNLNAGQKNWFTRNLKAAYPQLKQCKPLGADGKQHPSYSGIRFKSVVGHLGDGSSGKPVAREIRWV